MNRRKLYIGICFIFITLWYIWGNSLQSSIQSNEQSTRVLEVIEDIFNTPPLDTEEAQHIVRKAAHVTEFALLGMELVLLFYIAGRMCRQNLITVLFIGLIAAVLDETIQVYSQRGSQVMDVWIDFTGLVMGIGIGAIVNALWRRARMHMTAQKSVDIEGKRIFDLHHLHELE